jgi:hypothetical protein
VSDADPFLVAWGLFRRLETVETLPDSVLDELLDAAEAEIGIDGLLSGWALVAALLRHHLLEHARELGCDCGSLGWLETVQLHHFGQETDE